MKIDGAAAVVFGGASGLGEAAARRLAAMGAKVTIADRDLERGEVVARAVGGTAIEVDVTDISAVESAADLAADCGKAGLRVSVACAGVATPGKLIAQNQTGKKGSFADIIEINLLGTINCLRAAAIRMSANSPDDGGERGLCVNTASIAAFDGQIGQVAYAASKGGVVGLTLPAARELAEHRIRVMAIAPGIFDTPMVAGLPDQTRSSLAASIPFPARLGVPEEYGQLVAHLVENQMLNGETIRLDGAVRMPPR